MCSSAYPNVATGPLRPVEPEPHQLRVLKRQMGYPVYKDVREADVATPELILSICPADLANGRCKKGLVATNSAAARFQEILTCTPKFTALPKLSGRLPRIAGNASDWEHVLEEFLAYYNKLLDFTMTSQFLDMEVINADTIYMAQEAISRDVIVHCETKLLAAIENAQHKNKDIPKTYTYIDLSKLSCNGCTCFFAAYNRVHDTTWTTKGAHGKSYYPWMFPPILSGRDQVLTATYNTIVGQWVKSYGGYRQNFVSGAADFTAQLRGVPATGYYDEQIPADMQAMREIVRNLEQ
ncbi:predicted protein [Paecilomyces variotii No. 5]|uniref:Uncharacterized protein n=1 Tax=Byssochlamys spectabilis (strain No. 5 / NBRC 109023) TaxID=1356009 RepID=V5FY81_BYSSN|nr:predicted protein [Paecilomyces variotii No. 5]